MASSIAMAASPCCCSASVSSQHSRHAQVALLQVGKIGAIKVFKLNQFPAVSKRRRNLVCAVNQDAEEAFKKTVEVDRLIDTLRDANPNELPRLVAENVLAFNEGFWIRLAARTETCKSEDDKKDYEELAATLMSTVDCLVHKTNEKIESATDVLKSILTPVVDEEEEIPWPPRDPQALSLMEKIRKLGSEEAPEAEMGSLGAILKHPDEFYPLLKLKMAVQNAEKQIPPEPHWGFSYSMLHKVSRSFALVIQQLGTELRNAVCVFYLVLRALDTVEDDTSIATEVKVPILIDFHQHIYDCNWHFSCGTKDYKVLMEEFHLVSTAFLELERGYQEAIEDITKRMGAGMAKFICKEVETIDDYDEYCHYVAGLVGLGLSKLFYDYGSEDLAPDSLSNSLGLLLQKTNIIRDYLEDINEIPKSRMFWPREIWGKYVEKLEDLKYEKNSEKAVQCLNDMVTDALLHVEDCLKYMAALRDHAIFRFCAIPQIMAIGTLALCYNNIEVFRGVVKMRRAELYVL